MATADPDLTNRTGRVINAIRQLKLHAYADQGSKVLAYLPNGTLFKIKGVQREFYHVVVLDGAERGKMGYLWKERSVDGDYYVELVMPDHPPPLFPSSPTADPYAFPWPEVRSYRGGWIMGTGIAVMLLGFLYSCSGTIN